MTSIENLEIELSQRYLVQSISKSRNQRKYIIDNLEVIQNLLNFQEKERCHLITQQLLQTMGYVPEDEYVNVGKRIEIIIHLHRGIWPKRFEISPICDLLFEQLIVMIGYDDSDKINNTSRYKRYLAAQQFLNTH